MPEPLLHAVLPFSVMISSGVKPKKALLISLLGLLPDLDIVFHVHRSMSHSAFILLILCILAILILRKVASNHLNGAILCTLTLQSHLLLDLFTGYTPIVWPLFDQSIRITANMTINSTSQPYIRLNTKLLFSSTLFATITEIDAPLFTSEGLAITLALLVGALIKIVRDKLQISKKKNA